MCGGELWSHKHCGWYHDRGYALVSRQVERSCYLIEPDAKETGMSEYVHRTSLLPS